MTITLETRADINLAAAYRVAWRKETVRISDAALRRITACREAFLRLIDSESPPSIYGVTTAMGELASHRLGRHVVRRSTAGAHRAGHRLRPPCQFHRGTRGH